MGRKRKKSRKAPNPHDLILRLKQLSKNSRFRKAYDDFHDWLFRRIEGHIANWYASKDDRNRFRQELFSLLVHPSTAVVARQHPPFKTLIFSYNLVALQFRDKWGLRPQHPALVYDFNNIRHGWRAVLYAPGAHTIYVFPWTTKKRVLADYDAIMGKILVKSSRILRDREDLLVEFLATEGCDYETIAKGVDGRAAPKQRVSDEQEEELEREFIRKEREKLLQKGLNAENADKLAKTRATKKFFRRESKGAARVRKRLERLHSRLYNRLNRIPISSQFPQ